jgi:hypothetical protein
MKVNSVTVNGRPARFRFVQPTYPGDPNGPDDPAPAAHEASESNPVGGPVPGEQHGDPQQVITPSTDIGREPLVDLASHPSPFRRPTSLLHAGEPTSG